MTYKIPWTPAVTRAFRDLGLDAEHVDTLETLYEPYTSENPPQTFAQEQIDAAVNTLLDDFGLDPLKALLLRSSLEEYRDVVNKGNPFEDAKTTTKPGATARTAEQRRVDRERQAAWREENREHVQKLDRERKRRNAKAQKAQNPQP